MSRAVTQSKGIRAGIMIVKAALVCLAVSLSGCARPVSVVKEPVFFPPPPNAPRVQFLKSISGSFDVEERKDSFSLFVKGQLREDVDQQIIKPYGVTYAKGKLYVCDAQGIKVAIIDFANRKFEFLKGSVGAGRLKKPINVAVDDSGNIFVTDTIRKEVLMYDASGSFVRAYGKGIVKKPVDVAVDGTDLYILDLGDSDIKIVDRASGELQRKIGNQEGEPVRIAMPTNLTFDKNGQIYITNISLGNVVKIDKDGHFLASIGKLGDAFGEFTRPKGVAVGEGDRLYVVDGGTQNVQLFSESGRLLMFFGDPPLREGALNLPVAVAVTRENLEYFQKMAAPDFVVEEVIFVTNQQGAAKISIYGLGHKKGAEPSLAPRQPSAN